MRWIRQLHKRISSFLILNQQILNSSPFIQSIPRISSIHSSEITISPNKNLAPTDKIFSSRRSLYKRRRGLYKFRRHFYKPRRSL